jgi:ubiquinone/menaquinone biosynthesis C-methylase UbiE
MLTEKEMIALQADEHILFSQDKFSSIKDYVLHVISKSAYVQAARLSRNKVVLDLGCNTGFGSEIMAETADSVIGVDVSEKALEVAKQKFNKPNITFQKNDGVSLPFDDNTFDVIVSFQVIEHIVNYDNYIHEIQRVLKQDGVVLFTTPNMNLRLDPGMKPWNKFHVREFTGQTLNDLLKQYFEHAKVMGLFASEPLSSIEHARLRSALEFARKNAKSPLRRLLKTILPEKFVRFIKTSILARKSSDQPAESVVDFMNKYGLETIYYLPENLENALDLMGICAKEYSVLEKTWKNLPDKA